MPNPPHPSIPPVNGLVLAGGESTRMGSDKGLMSYHGLPQREHLWYLLQSLTENTFISCRPGQIADSKFPLLEDTWSDLGPFGAVLSAFQRFPGHAWLVVACDFPILDMDALQQLMDARNPSAYATSFWDDRAGQPEPWISILEPTLYPLLMMYESKGRSSLRGILEDYGCQTIRPLRPEILLNANTPEEAEEIKRKL